MYGVRIVAVRRGTKGNDNFIAGAGNEQFDGISGYDKVIYASASAGLIIDLTDLTNNTGAAAGDTYTNIKSFLLTKHDDTFIGSNGKDVANGDNGNDFIDGRSGNDTLTGHSGNDTLYGGWGSDAIWGGGGNDTVLGGGDNDQIWGDAGTDTLTGGKDAGTLSVVTTSAQYYQYAANQFVLLSKIDDYGEWVEVPKYHAVEEAGQLTSLGRAGGDAIFVLTNGFNSARNWNAQVTGQPVDLGPSGQINGDTSVIFNMGQLAANATVRIVGEIGRPGPVVAGYNAESIVTKTTTAISMTFGDTLTGGSGADVFVFNTGDGVDRITDFQIGVDHIDLAANWFDGSALNGEVSARDYNGGTLILFTDNSADGYLDNNAIYLAGRAISSFDNAMFV
jgi:Ca2+-binding RTX toxin-like protein